MTLALLVTKAALWRKESRGGHFRTDFPERDEQWRVHSIQRLEQSIETAASINFEEGAQNEEDLPKSIDSVGRA